MAIASGVRFNHYVILSQLGSGGMGEIYLAQDTKLGRRVALKLLLTQFTSDEERVHRFEQEARAASALNHPNIITIFEIGHDNETHFIATEFVEGQTINQRIKLGKLDLIDALDVAIQSANALVAAHAAGIVHRDIKPENVMLRPDGYVKVLDFGLAKLTEKFDSDEDIDPEATTKPLRDTSPGVIMGTVSYMSPEQARGHKVDSRSDLFSLGCVIYEMVTGQKPFRGDTMSDVMAAVLESEPVPIVNLAPEAPAELQWIISKALSKNRESRYQTAKELLNDLKRLKQQLEFKAEQARQNRTTLIGENLTNSSFRRSGSLRRSGNNSGRKSGETFNSLSYDTEVIESSRSLSSAEFLFSKVQDNKRTALLITILFLALAAAAGYFWTKPAPVVTDSIAVLPFARLSAEPLTDSLADGVTQGLIQNLSRIPKLKVRSMVSVQRYKVTGSTAMPNPRDVGQDLQVPLVLTGSITKRENLMAVNVELVDAKDNSFIWGQKYERKPGELLALQEEITSEVSQRLKLDLTPEEQVVREAYQLYLRGRYHWNRRTVADLKRGVDSFEQAIKRAPKYAPAYAGLADSYNMLGTYGALSSAEAGAKAKEAAEQALALDSNLAEAHSSLAFVKHRYDWDWLGAEEEFKRAITLDSNYATAHQWYSSYLMAVGRPAEAIEEARRCQEMAPLSLIISSHLAWMLYNAGQYQEAIEQCQKVLAIDPNFFAARRYLGLAYEQVGKTREAIEELTKARDLSGNASVILAALIHTHVISGNKSEARRLLNEALANQSQRKISAYDQAIIQTAFGDKQQAFALLDKAFEERSEYLPYLVVEPRLETLRTDARFTALLDRLKLPQ
ncbi:MAG: protein kinase [Acidobacteriota bacterium]|nr:protein kinase [Acidobacteriota bacterium]